jgi:FG-GAP repeat
MSHPSRPWNSLVQRAESCGVSTRAVAVLVAIGACPGVFGQTLVRVHHGSDLSSAIGGQVASLGDVDGDGVPDYCAADVFAEGCPVPPPSIRVYSGASGSEIYGLYSGNGSLWTFSGYGISIDAGADLSGDGIGDIVVGAPYKTPGYGSFGSVYVYSGANGALIRQQFKGIYGEQFGHIVHFLSDLDLDGAVEYGVHSEVDTAHGSKPSITIYSGANGLAHVVMANQYLDTFVRVDDRNGDGIDDVAAGESGWSSGAWTYNGRVQLLSGSDGSVIATIFGASHLEGLGRQIAALEDRTGDGIGELAIAHSPGIKIFDSANNLPLFSIQPPPNSDLYLGGRMVEMDDTDGDGYRELLASQWFGGGSGVPFVASAILLDVGTGTYRMRRDNTLVNDPVLDTNFPEDLRSAGDVDQDGRLDWLLGTSGIMSFAEGWRGLVEVRSCRPLVANRNEISLSHGLSVDLALNAGIANGGRSYIVLASYTGTAGIQLGAVAVPLAYDVLTELSILFANTQVFQNTYGVLNANGNALARFDGSALPAVAQGLTFHFASVVFGAGGGYVASNPESVYVNILGL